MFENLNYLIERFFTIALSFLFVIFLSLWVERYVKIINIDQPRPTSIFFKQESNKNLLKFLKRYGAIGLRYIEIIFLAILGLLLEYGVRIWITKSYAFIFPLILMFISFSFITIVMCVPKKSKEYFSPYWYETGLSILLFFGGLIWIILMLKPS